MTIWADGDSLPSEVRRIICRRANREALSASSAGKPARFRAVFVAARMPPLDAGPGVEAIAVAGPRDAPLQKSEGDSLRVVSGPRRGPETADDRISQLAAPGDLAVTRDLPLAERLAGQGLRVLNDRGEVFGSGDARERRSLRDAAVELRALGLAPESPRRSAWGERERKAFADALDRELAKASSKSP